jgi:glutathione S-transferase
MKLVIATPSPFARKARIALIEKGLPHEIVVQNPWQTRIEANPLGKVPALVLDDGRVVHDSSVIVEYLETLGVPPILIPADPALRVAHKQIEALADGICDAVVLIVAERARPPEMQSATWIARQAAKIPAALKELENSLGQKGHFTSHGFGLAEIATACALGYLDLRYPELVWRQPHPRLAALAARLEARPSFAASRPMAQEVPMK